jgi:hypothetical protein
MADNLVTVKTFQFVPEAEAARMHLEEQGIQSFLADAETVNMDWLLGNALGYVKLQVSSDQAEAAAAILQRIPANRSRSDDGEETTDAASCLSCGAKLLTDHSVCPSCGWSYASGDDDKPGEADAHESEHHASRSGGASAMAMLRKMRRPMIWIIVAPFLIIAAWAVLAVTSLVVRAFMR